MDGVEVTFTNNEMHIAVAAPIPTERKKSILKIVKPKNVTASVPRISKSQ